MNGYPTKFIDNAMKTPRSVREKSEYQSSVSLPYIGSTSHKIDRILKEVGIQVRFTILVKTNCFDLFACTHKDRVLELMNFRNVVCTTFLVNVVWFTSVD